LFRACLCRCRSNGKDFEELNRGQLSLRLIVLLVLGRPGTLARVVPDSAINRRICLASYGPKWPGKHKPRVYPGLPWAKFSCLFGAGLSGRMTGAKHIQIAGLLSSVPPGH
jgi:hypothetical protein